MKESGKFKNHKGYCMLFPELLNEIRDKLMQEL